MKEWEERDVGGFGSSKIQKKKNAKINFFSVSSQSSR